MAYKIKEIYLSLQGEGIHAGTAAVFCRFSGCNLWSGHEKDRKSAICNFCDTDFTGTDGPGGGVFKSPEQLVSALMNAWKNRNARPFAVFTGGEPLLQVDDDLMRELNQSNIRTAVETNGTLPVPSGFDWVCVSPKAGSDLIVRTGDELKLVFPQKDLDPESFREMKFDHFLLQPMDGPDLEENTRLAVSYILEHPWWKLSLQTHKFIQIP